MTSPKISYEQIENRSLEASKWANLVMCISGVIAAYASRSDALLVDGLYSGVNFVAAIIAVKVTETIRRPKDQWFPFGYDAYEAIYVKYRSMVLLGIMSLAIFAAVSKIITYATGGDVPELIMGPILIYMLAMVVICFSMAIWHRYNWELSGRRSEILATERRASIVDAIITASAGCGLLASTLLRGTALDFIVPIADSLIVLFMCGFIVWQPLSMLLGSLNELAGRSADRDLVKKTINKTEEIARDLPVDILAVPVTKLGRTYFVVSYVEPNGAVSAKEIDEFREELRTAYQDLLGNVRCEVIVTAEHPFPRVDND